MTNNTEDSKLDSNIAKIVRGLKLEYYDLLHKHGYADFKFSEPSTTEYEKDEIWLSNVYEAEIKALITQRELKARLDEWGNHVAIEGEWSKEVAEKRITELTAQLKQNGDK